MDLGQFLLILVLFSLPRKPTEVQWRYTEEGERVRVSLRTGRILPLPLRQRRDGVVPEQWIGELGGFWGSGGGI